MLDGSTETCWNSDQSIHHLHQSANSSNNSTTELPSEYQWIVLTFKQPVVMKSIHLLFQGGFVGQPFNIVTPSTSTDSKNFTKHIGTYEPVDNNHLQRFDIEQAYINTGRQGVDNNTNTNTTSSNNSTDTDTDISSGISRGISAMRMNFLGSTDFFGRICIYKLDVIGYPV